MLTPHARSMRRLLLSGAAALIVLAGCGGNAEPDAKPQTAGSDIAKSAAAYPVTIDHQFGKTTIPAAPKRIIAIGYNEADFVLALGEVPVGVRDFIGDFDEDSRSWAKDKLAGATPTKVGGNEIDFEKVAELDPDLILGVYAFMEQKDYKLLSEITETIGQPGQKTATWQEQILVTGKALNKEDEAKRIVADVERQFTDAAKANPAFKGKSIAVAMTGGTAGTFYVLEPTDLRAQFFTDLGFVNTKQTGEVSAENYELLDQDVLVVLGADKEVLAGNALFQKLAAVREGRTFYSGTFASEFSGALGFASPLSLPRALEIAVPQLAAATTR